jgi:peptide-methionine (S)-S-oxide reductase
VHGVMPGYAGGTVPNPTYEDVSSGTTGHAEVTRVEYNSDEINYSDLLTVFFAAHDPTTRNRQGNDIGTQYRSVIFYTTPEQKQDAELFIQKLNNSTKEGKPIVTEVEPLDVFYEAESYHQDYYARNKNAPYCELVINPKLDKIQHDLEHLLKEKSRKE